MLNMAFNFFMNRQIKLYLCQKKRSIRAFFSVRAVVHFPENTWLLKLSLNEKESHGGISSIDIKGSTKMAYVIIN